MGKATFSIYTESLLQILLERVDHVLSTTEWD